MENLGKNIMEFRRKNNLTQSELGQKLSISAQAVSKWEKGLSEPDIDTIKKMCEIFSCTINELTDAGAAVGGSGQNIAAAEHSSPPAEPVIILGYCSDCNKPLHKPDEYKVVPGGAGAPQTVLCNKCHLKKQYKNASFEYDEHRRERNRSFIWAGLAAGAAFIILLVAGIVTANYLLAFGGGIVLAYVAFALVSQLFWDNAVTECMGFFCRSFRMPGLIFSLDLDGIIWFICVKLTLSVLAGLLSALVFVIGLAVSGAFAAVFFPFGLAGFVREGNELKNKACDLKKSLDDMK